MRISDWSSDVCSSDLYIVGSLAAQAINDGSYNILDPSATPVDVLNSIKATITRNSNFTTKEAFGNDTFNDLFEMGGGRAGRVVRSEERRGGKVCVSTCRYRGPR